MPSCMVVARLSKKTVRIRTGMFRFPSELHPKMWLFKPPDPSFVSRISHIRKPPTGWLWKVSLYLKCLCCDKRPPCRDINPVLLRISTSIGPHASLRNPFSARPDGKPWSLHPVFGSMGHVRLANMNLTIRHSSKFLLILTVRCTDPLVWVAMYTFTRASHSAASYWKQRNESRFPNGVNHRNEVSHPKLPLTHTQHFQPNHLYLCWKPA